MARHHLGGVSSGQAPVPARKGSARTRISPLVPTLLAAGAIAFAPAAADAQQAAPGQSQDHQELAGHAHSPQGRPWALVGVWLGTTATGLKQLITFHGDGTVSRSVPGEAGIDPARPPHTTAHGVWRPLGHGRFGATMWDIFYDISTAQLKHFMRIRLEVTLGEDRDHASGTAVLEVIDPQGVVVSSRTGTITFVRIPFEPLP